MEKLVRLAQDGDVESQLNLARLYISQAPSNYAEVEKWIRVAAEAEYRPGSFSEVGAGVPKIEASLIEWWHNLAEAGHLEAQTALGLYLIKKYPRKSVSRKWLNKAVERGSVEAMNAVGEELSSGDHYNQDLEGAVAYWKRAADRGYIRSQKNLGDAYFRGKGVLKDYVQAFSWFSRAAEQGDASAQFTIAIWLGEGIGTPQNKSVAVEWYRRSAEQGFVGAQVELGLVYACGEGIPRDFVQAAKWLYKAADSKDAMAAMQLGLLYLEAPKTSRSLVLAGAWLCVASNRGLLNARPHLNELLSKMTLSQQDQAIALGADWEPGKILATQENVEAIFDIA